MRITIYIPPAIHDRMARAPHMNWSRICQQAIERALRPVDRDWIILGNTTLEERIQS